MKNVSKLFRDYGLYNNDQFIDFTGNYEFQSSFELTGYITKPLKSAKAARWCFKALSSLRVI